MTESFEIEEFKSVAEIKQQLGNSEQLTKPSSFDVLSSVSVKNKVQQKGGLWYLSWSNALRELLKKYPGASWDFAEYDGLPYLKTETGYYVACTVVVNSISRTQMMPVLDYRNKVVASPDAAQVNKSQMRALTKAIALHGLGLELWAGEDVDQEEEQKVQEEPGYPWESFKANLPKWEAALKEGKITRQQIIDMCNSRAKLNSEQIKRINETFTEDAPF